jgi:serine protease Do
MLGDNSDDGEQQIPVQPGSPLDKFFRQFGQEFGPHAPRRHGAITGEGSGFFITADGYAVTNNHVVDHATSVQVTPTTAQSTPQKWSALIPRPISP